jgi:hypothetical protein
MRQSPGTVSAEGTGVWMAQRDKWPQSPTVPASTRELSFQTGFLAPAGGPGHLASKALLSQDPGKGAASVP